MSATFLLKPLPQLNHKIVQVEQAGRSPTASFELLKQKQAVFQRFCDSCLLIMNHDQHTRQDEATHNLIAILDATIIRKGTCNADPMPQENRASQEPLSISSQDRPGLRHPLGHHKTLLSLMDFPYIWEKVLLHLDSFHELRMLRLVSRLWRDYIDQHILASPSRKRTFQRHYTQKRRRVWPFIEMSRRRRIPLPFCCCCGGQLHAQFV